MVALLLKNKADPDLPWPGNAHATPLYVASANNHPEVVALLLEYNADPDLPWPGNAHATPLNIASASNHLEVVTLLLQYNADPDNHRVMVPLRFISLQKEPP